MKSNIEVEYDRNSGKHNVFIDNILVFKEEYLSNVVNLVSNFI